MVGSVFPEKLDHALKYDESLANAGRYFAAGQKNPILSSGRERKHRYFFDVPVSNGASGIIPSLETVSVSYDESEVIDRLRKIGLLDVPEGRLALVPHRLRKKRPVHRPSISARQNNHPEKFRPDARTVKDTYRINELIKLEIKSLGDGVPAGETHGSMPRYVGVDGFALPQDGKKCDPEEVPDNQWCVDSMNEGADGAYFLWQLK